MKCFFSCSTSLSSLFLGLMNVDDNSTAGQRVKGRWLFQSSWRSEYCQCPCQSGGSLTVYMEDAIWAQWSVERRRVSQAEPEWRLVWKGFIKGALSMKRQWGQQHKAGGRAEQGCGLGWRLASATPAGSTGMWIRTTPELVPLWARGLAFSCT